MHALYNTICQIKKKYYNKKFKMLQTDKLTKKYLPTHTSKPNMKNIQINTLFIVKRARNITTHKNTCNVTYRQTNTQKRNLSSTPPPQKTHTKQIYILQCIPNNKVLFQLVGNFWYFTNRKISKYWVVNCVGGKSIYLSPTSEILSK